MNDKTRERQRIQVAIHWEEEAYQQALGDDDFAELDRINHRARHLMAYCAAHGWRAELRPPQPIEPSYRESGDRNHERIGP